MSLRCFFVLKACLNGFRGNFPEFFPWEKSMLSRWRFPMVCSPDYGHYCLGHIDGGESLD